jgi:hypothetical protein
MPIVVSNSRILFRQLLRLSSAGSLQDGTEDTGRCSRLPAGASDVRISTSGRGQVVPRSLRVIGPGGGLEATFEQTRQVLGRLFSVVVLTRHDDQEM